MAVCRETVIWNELCTPEGRNSGAENRDGISDGERWVELEVFCAGRLRSGEAYGSRIMPLACDTI